MAAAGPQLTSHRREELFITITFIYARPIIWAIVFEVDGSVADVGAEMERNLLLFLTALVFLPWASAQGQVDLPPGYIRPNDRIKTEIGGSYSNNATLFFRNSPYKVSSDLTVESGATLTIETGVQIYFDTGVGIKVKGAIHAVGSEFVHIEMLPFQQMLNYEEEFPDFRLIDGPSVRQGRLQVKFRDRWRSVCTKVTNWTSIDTGTACRSMGYSDGGFWKWMRRNNDTYPFVMPKPNCGVNVKNLWECPGFADQDRIPLSENLCQGEDDIAIFCWGHPSFNGWAKHWKGLQIINSPYKYVYSDPDMVAFHKESLSRLEYVDIMFGGYDASLKNTTAALWIEGVPPIMNGIRVERSAQDGIYIHEPSGPGMIANSTVTRNRGHGIVVDNTTDARMFINMTAITHNYGDGVWYRQKHAGINLVQKINTRSRRQSLYYEEETPRVEMCINHSIPPKHFFPHLIRAYLRNGTAIDPTLPNICWLTVSLPPRLAYTYTLQFVGVTNLNPLLSGTKTNLIVCDADSMTDSCAEERYSIPIIDGIFPQSLPVRSSGKPVYVGLKHDPGPLSNGFLYGDIDVQFRIHASVLDKAYYGLNITNSIIAENVGNGVFAQNVRDRVAFTNVSVSANQGIAGIQVRDGAADIWVNDTSIVENWGDGMNISYSGGSININGTILRRNRWRGFAFHHNASSPFLPLRYEIVFKGRPSNNIFYKRTIIADNLWGGVLVGNFCVPATHPIEPKILINWVEFVSNHYHPSFEFFSCQRDSQPSTVVDFTGNRVDGGSGMGFRIEPAVNTMTLVSSNQFLNNNNTALLIRNAKHPQLVHLPADVTISKNSFKFNSGQYIISIGLNEDAAKQKLVFNQQNEVRENTIFKPFPHLKPRSTPYAAMVVSSSNVVIHRNCFKNPRADYEIATELGEHAKWIDARENSWGHQFPDNFMHRIFDQFNRYSLSTIEVNPFAAVCNQRNPHITSTQQYYRQFRRESQPYVLGGTIFENHDLDTGKYTVTDDLHIVPGAKLTVGPGTILEFYNGVGMLVQGELIRADFRDSPDPVIFTSKPFVLPHIENIRLMDENYNEEVTAGRLEVLIDGQWGTICNRSWTPNLAQMACNQLGLTMDPQFFENWRIFPSQGDLPMVMDNIRCEEREWDITRCRHDGLRHNVAASCRPTEVVGIRCAEPKWAGVRYSLLANPPMVTGQTSMNNWIIERAGLFDFRTSQFSPALQIDWNYHTFHDIVVRDNFFDGIDIVYNDLTKKPAIRNSISVNNRRNAMRVRSVGITVERVRLNQNGNAGLRYDPHVSEALQRDIVTWLERKEQPEMEANNVFTIPNRNLNVLQVFESQLNHRKFLLAKATVECPLVLLEPCVHNMEIEASGYEYGMSSRLAIQIVNRPGNDSDEDAIFTDYQTGRQLSLRQNPIDFPFVSSGNRLSMKYTRSFGEPKMIILILFLDAQEYLDRFLHVYRSEIADNQYGISSIHYSNLSLSDGAVLNRWGDEKLWFQKVNFTRNSEAVVWINSPQHEIVQGSPIADITYHIDNCSIAENTGSIIDTHRDLFASANVFHWNLWSNTFEKNRGSGLTIHLPDTYDLLAKKAHSFLMTENRFQNNTGMFMKLSGYYTFANISSNNFTDNFATPSRGILEITGMEKNMVIERNRFLNNWGPWLIKVNIESHSLRNMGAEIPAFIQYNYFQFNEFLNSSQDYVDMSPRSFAVGLFGAQRIDVHFNRFSNKLLDFELVGGVRPHLAMNESVNVTYNWWGVGNEAEISQRIFDFDDWNIFTVADFSPYYVTEELFINFWWRPHKGQLATATSVEPDVFDLKGRMYESKTLRLQREQWHDFPRRYKPFRPYRITRDLIIMPGATLTVEQGVEVHLWVNARILVYGELIIQGTYEEPVRFKPINTTEYLEIRGKISSRYRREVDWFSKTFDKRRISTLDPVFKQFPTLYRADPYYQRFKVALTDNGTIPGRSGFLQIYNATTGEWIPSCDRQFTLRNAQVVCRELGFETQNVYHWVTPRWDYNPLVRILKTYVEPRECRGDESSLDRCNLRLTGNVTMWQCVDSEHFNYVHCGDNKTLSDEYIGNWGGITLSTGSLELEQTVDKGKSVFRHVEIVGAGLSHDSSFASGALQLIHRIPLLESVNITNSSMDGLQIIGPRDRVILSKLNVTDNRGLGYNIISMNLQATSASSRVPKGPITLPYEVHGMLNLCSAGKSLVVKGRIVVYYKYDSFSVDCIKIFSAGGRKLSFRFIQINFYPEWNGLGRPDSLSIYSDSTFSPSSLLQRFSASSSGSALPIQASTLALHMRASAADGIYGFIAEIMTLPSVPDSNFVENVEIRYSRVARNDRGAIQYRNTGESGPKLLIDSTAIDYNGYFLFGNMSTSNQAVELHLHNTLQFMFLASSLRHNRGGLLVSAESSSAVARMNGLIKDSVFAFNDNSTALAFLGNNYQKMALVNNIISNNYALYHDTVLVIEMSVNFTHNLFSNNTGLHTVDMHGYSRISREMQSFYDNFLQHNLALGHGHQYKERYGYQPNPPNEDEFLRRTKRQVLSQSGTSFDWWTHVGPETSRFRSTILAGSSHQKYFHNVFNNPLNPYELTTCEQSQFDSTAIDARDNYWGYPGTAGVAASKIRDQDDYDFLIKVDYQPVLESNTSLLEGDCPPGWFQAGYEEFKSCYLYVGGAMTYRDAVAFCHEMDAFLPFLRTNDARQENLASRIDRDARRFRADVEMFGVPLHPNDFWISSVNIRADQCGFLSARTGQIAVQNCNNLLPFVCETGTKPYEEPVLWRPSVIISVVVLAVTVLLVCCLALCWLVKSRDRKRYFDGEKRFVRESIRASKHKNLKQSWVTAPDSAAKVSDVRATFGDTDSITRAHQNMVRGIPAGSFTHSEPSTTLSNSLSTDDYDYTSSYYTRSTLPSRDLVSKRPDPYAQSVGSSSFQPSSRKTFSSTQPSSVTETTATCSTCPSERDSTITEETSSSFDDTISARSSETASTLTEHPLLSAPRPADYFRGTGRPLLTPSRSNPSLYHQPVPVATPQVPTTHRPTQPRTPGHYMNLARPNHPPPPQPPPKKPQPSRSLVDLYNPHYAPPALAQGSRQRRGSMGHTIPLETSM
ncbi:hypothetical protein QR680_004996 [Steinernema hermaphroditum]|uniref:SRCR domain-containing protein n=1 Tax=Steinernema hermaphroditum TaxID=289476 RepID=A0AA39HQH0_9BILA|nr:hypothetical protein QR680_004996 [Steinernema hermaphroditum]